MPRPLDLSVHRVWVWTGRHTSGAQLRGHLEAVGPFHARALLRRQGIQVQRLHRSWWLQGWNLLSLGLRGTPLVRQVPQRELAAFIRQWAALMEAGIPLLGAFEVLAQTAFDGHFSLTLRWVISDLQQGTPLSAALRKRPHAFDALTCDLIQAAESAGALAPVLTRLAQDLERKIALLKKVQSALMYPAVVLGVCGGVMSVILTWVVPAFEEVYQAMGGELPWATRLLVAFAAQARSSAVGLMFALIIGAGGVVWQWRRRPGLRLWVAQRLLGLPVWGQLLCHAAVARWSRTLATLSAAGIPLAEALESIAPACGQAVFTLATQDIRREVSQGLSLSAAIQRSGVFPEVVARLVAVGEEAGALESMLMRVAQYHEGELDTLTQRLAVALEPLLMILMGTMVGAAVLALYWPMFNLGNAL